MGSMCMTKNLYMGICIRRHGLKTGLKKARGNRANSGGLVNSNRARAVCWVLLQLVPRIFVPYCAGLTKRARKFRCRIDFDWFWNQWNLARSKIPRSFWSFIWKLSMRRSSIFSDIKLDVSRVACFLTAGLEERTPWVREWVSCCTWTFSFKICFVSLYYCFLVVFK